MKNIIILLITCVSFAQNWDTSYFIQGTTDLKMNLIGPYEGENDIGTTFNGEFSVGWEKTKGDHGVRIAHRVEIHPAIDYTKATWLEVAYKRKVWVFDCYLGVELQTIYRENPNYNVLSPTNYTKYLNTPLQTGLNAEIQYMIPGTKLGLTSNLNVFQAEDIGKNVRWDVMTGIVLKIE